MWGKFREEKIRFYKKKKCCKLLPYSTMLSLRPACLSRHTLVLSYPEGGRLIMVEKGKPEIIKAELVLLAMGFLKPEHPEFPKNVFVCGDSANGASFVVHAMASGLQTAKKVDAFLKA